MEKISVDASVKANVFKAKVATGELYRLNLLNFYPKKNRLNSGTMQICISSNIGTE